FEIALAQRAGCAPEFLRINEADKDGPLPARGGSPAPRCELCGNPHRFRRNPTPSAAKRAPGGALPLSPTESRAPPRRLDDEFCCDESFRARGAYLQPPSIAEPRQGPHGGGLQHRSACSARGAKQVGIEDATVDHDHRRIGGRLETIP